MYRHVIVPFDGVLEHRAVLAPAADLAWRCGAKLVVVTTNASLNDDIRAVLKVQAMSKSGADADFWVDLGVEIGDALVSAARHRADPVICITTRHRRPGVLRKRPTQTPLPEEVLRDAPCPVVVVGPETDVSRGLPFSAVYVPFGPGLEGEMAAVLAARWADEFRIAVHLVAMVPPGGDAAAITIEAEAMVARLRKVVPSVVLEVVETARPGAALAAIASDDPDAIVILGGTGRTGDAVLGPVAADVVATSQRAVVFPPPA